MGRRVNGSELNCLPFDIYKDCKFLMLRRRAVSRCSEILITFAGKNTRDLREIGDLRGGGVFDLIF